MATEFAARAAAAVPAELADERQGLVALQRITGFMHGLPEEGYRSGSVPQVAGDGDISVAVTGRNTLGNHVTGTVTVHLDGDA